MSNLQVSSQLFPFLKYRTRRNWLRWWETVGFLRNYFRKEIWVSSYETHYYLYLTFCPEEQSSSQLYFLGLVLVSIPLFGWKKDVLLTFVWFTDSVRFEFNMLLCEGWWRFVSFSLKVAFGLVRLSVSYSNHPLPAIVCYSPSSQ